MIYKNLVFLLVNALAIVNHVQADDDAVCKSQLAPGDLQRGLSAIVDPACMDADGCFRVNDNTNCRYCKNDATVESEYQVCQVLLDEIKLGSRTCAQSISIGDKNKGLIAFYDPTCDDPLADGLGCFNHCRLCQDRGNARTPYYRCDALPTSPPSVAPTSQDSDSQGTDIGLSCYQKLSEDEKASGIGAVKDMTCQLDDASCFDNTCRYCKVFLTPVSRQYDACKNNACLVKVSEGDRAVGISAFLDDTCLQGSKTGCWGPDNVCRYCKVFDTPASSHFADCYAQPDTSGSGSKSF